MIIDSNIIIYSIQPGYKPLQRYLLERINLIHASAITKIEVVGFSRLSHTDKQLFEQFFANIITLPITDEVVAEAIRLRQQRKRSLGDSIIAATASLQKLPILTNNTAAFDDISGLEIISMASVL